MKRILLIALLIFSGAIASLAQQSKGHVSTMMIYKDKNMKRHLEQTYTLPAGKTLVFVEVGDIKNPACDDVMRLLAPYLADLHKQGSIDVVVNYISKSSAGVKAYPWTSKFANERLDAAAIFGLDYALPAVAIIDDKGYIVGTFPGIKRSIENFKSALDKELMLKEMANFAEDVQGHEAVDLGLSVKWASCNLGAETYFENGDFLSWGESKSKRTYNGETSRYNKSRSWLLSHLIINKTDNLVSSEDVVSIRWGNSWRLPSKFEFSELIEKCRWEQFSQNGMKGYKVIGPNGRYILLPASGWMSETSLVSQEHACYWTSTLSWALSCAEGECEVTKCDLWKGFLIRGVTES